jgi:selenocysteine lyase/cysteine desulfurase
MTGHEPLIPCQRHLFDLPREVAYLNCAYMSPLLNRAVEAGREAAARKARPWEIHPQDFFTDSERARGLFATLLGCPTDDVAIVPSASYGLAVAAQNLEIGVGRRVLVLPDQFPSNVYVWRTAAARSGGEVVTVPEPEDGDLTRAILDVLDERVVVAALPHCRWTDGALLDLERIGLRCREVGAALVVDATQSLGALPFDLRAIQPDFVACPGYKWLLGPYSFGYLYVAAAHQDGRPLEENWIGRERSEDFAGLTRYRDRYQPGARRFDMGERSNFTLLPMSMVALEQLLAWGIERIAATLRARTRTIAKRAAELGLAPTPEDRRPGHYLGIRFPGGPPPHLLERLAAKGVYLSVRGDSLRVTPHLYNDEEDVERLFEALEPLL